MKRNFYHMNHVRAYFAALAVILFLSTSSFAQWTIYDASVLPDAATPAFGVSSGVFSADENKLVDDDAIEGNKILWMNVPGKTGITGQTAFYWRMNFATLNIDVTNLTVVMRIKGHLDRDMAMDIDMHYSDLRSRISLHNGTNLARIRNGVGTDATLTNNLQEWNIYRFIMTATQTSVYINEEPTPVLTFTPAAAVSANRHFRFGDGDSGNNFGADIDWVIWDVSGAYAPGEGTAIPASLLPKDPEVPVETTWNIYEASVLPDANDPVFGTSGLAGNGMQSQLVVDPKDEDNSFLELITETVADNGTWRRVFPDPVTDLTVVMRVRAANTNGRRVLELDLDNGGWRERLYINQEANMVRLQHSAGFGVDNEFPLRDGASVSAWHIYRLTKDSEGNVKLYVDENPTPLAEGKSAQASATNNHFRFGDTNGSHNVSALIDWVIWDTTGAFAPGEGSAIPEGLIPTYQLSSNADLAQVLINEQPLTGFDANVLEYEVMLAPHVSPVPVVSAAAAEQVAQVIVTQPAQVDGEAVITVIAEDGTVKKYIIDFVLDPTNVPLVDQASFRVFPNPASQNLTIDVAAFSSDMQLSIFNASGQLLRSQKLVSQRQVIDVSDFNQGVYIVKISSRNAQSVKMFVKQ
jgi:hypothetical protein